MDKTTTLMSSATSGQCEARSRKGFAKLVLIDICGVSVEYSERRSLCDTPEYV